MTSQRASLLVVLIMAVSLIPAGVQADELPSVNITTDWVGDGPTDVEHAYVLTFSDNGSYGLDIDLRHERGGALLASNLHRLGQHGRCSNGTIDFRHGVAVGRFHRP